jgi:hypothetical protein
VPTDAEEYFHQTMHRLYKAVRRRVVKGWWLEQRVPEGDLPLLVQQAFNRQVTKLGLAVPPEQA